MSKLAWSIIPHNVYHAGRCEYPVMILTEFASRIYGIDRALVSVISDSVAIDRKWLIQSIRSCVKSKSNVIQYWLSQGGVQDVPASDMDIHGSEYLIQYRHAFNQQFDQVANATGFDNLNFNRFSLPLLFHLGNSVKNSINLGLFAEHEDFEKEYFDLVTKLAAADLMFFFDSFEDNLPKPETPVHVFLVDQPVIVNLGSLTQVGWRPNVPPSIIESE